MLWRNCEKQLSVSSCLSVHPSFRPSVRPSACSHGTTRFSLEKVLWNMMCVDCWEICRDKRIYIYDNKWLNFTIVWPCIVTDSLWIKPTDALNSSFIVITTLHVSGSLSGHHQEFLAVHRLWYILCSCDRLLPGLGWKAVPSYCW